VAKFRINGPNGEEFEIEAPDDASDEQIMQFVQAEAPKTKLPDIGTGQSALVGGVQGASFGFADEIMGGASALAAKAMGNPADLSTLYGAAVSVPRMAQDSAAEHHPVAYYGGQIAGGVAPAVASGGAGAIPGMARAGLGMRSLAAGGEGAAYGALHGAGSAEGGLAERATGAGVGAVTGAVGGAMMPGAVDLGGAAWRGVSSPVRGILQPTQFGQQKAAEALLRDRNPAGFAGRGPRGASEDLARLRGETGKDLMLADMGGENTRNLLRSATNMASTGAQRLNRTLDVRQGNQWRRIERDMSRGLGSPDDYAASVDQIIAERAANATDDFGKAYSAPWNVRGDDPLVEVVGRKYMQRVIEKTAESVEGTTGANVAQMRPWELLHRVRMQMDREINGLKSGVPDAKANWDANDLLRLKHDIDDAISKNNPLFKQAINRYSGDSALKGAAQDGFDEGLKISTEDLARKMRSFKNDSEREMYRMGVARAIAGKMRRPNVTSDRTENVFSSPDIQLRLKAIFPDNRSLREFQRDLVVEARMADTRKAVQGNSTTAKQLINAQESGQPAAAVGALANAATGRFEPLLNSLSRTANRFSGLTPSTSNAVINALMSRGGDDVGQEMGRALERAGMQPLRRAQQARAYNALLNSGLAPYLNND
jgi:hypothetical protein